MIADMTNPSTLPYDAVVQLSGGFGNQLFQYAFGMQLAAIHHLRVAYDTQFYETPNSVAHNRLRLPDYGFDVPRAGPPPKHYALARRFKWLPPPTQSALFGLSYIKCPATRFVLPPIETSTVGTSPAYFTGLWQSPRYFADIQPEVRDTFRRHLLAAAPGPQTSSAPANNVVGFHVRRGDYLAHKQSENLDYAAYLASALATLTQATNTSAWQVRVFTDDPDWCERHLAASNVTIYRGTGMIDDFVALMQCRHKIISNSTFAWWAAFLGETENALTLAPDRWHATATNHQAQILPSNWLVVEK